VEATIVKSSVDESALIVQAFELEIDILVE
jgi:hypothetical protein